MTEIEKRILENQKIMLEALLYLTMKCDTQDQEIRGVMKRRLTLDQARTKTEALLKQVGGDQV